jgi:hypothetical protein
MSPIIAKDGMTSEAFVGKKFTNMPGNLIGVLHAYSHMGFWSFLQCFYVKKVVSQEPVEQPPVCSTYVASHSIPPNGTLHLKISKEEAPLDVRPAQALSIVASFRGSPKNPQGLDPC